MMDSHTRGVSANVMNIPSQYAASQGQSVIIIRDQVVDLDRHICTFCCCCKCCHIKYACIFLLVMELLFSIPEGVGGYAMAAREDYPPMHIAGIVLLCKQALILLAIAGVWVAICTLRSCPVVLYMVVHGIYIAVLVVILIVFICGLAGAFAIPAEIDRETGVFAVNDIVKKLDRSGLTQVGNPINAVETGFHAIQGVMIAGVVACLVGIALQGWVISKFAQLMRYLDEARRNKQQAELEMRLNSDQVQQHISQHPSAGDGRGAAAHLPTTVGGGRDMSPFDAGSPSNPQVSYIIPS